MKGLHDTLQSVPSPSEQPDRGQHLPTCLDECGDVLSIEELARAIGRSVRSIEADERRGTFPIKRVNYNLPATRTHLPRKYAKVAVERFLARRSV